MVGDVGEHVDADEVRTPAMMILRSSFWGASTSPATAAAAIQPS
jgi:hypothetical protein